MSSPNPIQNIQALEAAKSVIDKLYHTPLGKISITLELPNGSTTNVNNEITRGNWEAILSFLTGMIERSSAESLKEQGK